MNSHIFLIAVSLLIFCIPLKADPIFEYNQKSVDAHFVKLDALENLHIAQPHVSITKFLEMDIFQDVIIEKNVSLSRDPEAAIRRKSFGIGMLLGLGCVAIGYGFYYLLALRGY